MIAETPEEWTDEQNSLFTRLHKMMSDSPSIFMHPDAPRMSDVQWATVAWNAAWTAAEMLGSDGDIVYCDSETVEQIAGERTGMLQ